MARYLAVVVGTQKARSDLKPERAFLPISAGYAKKRIAKTTMMNAAKGSATN